MPIIEAKLSDLESQPYLDPDWARVLAKAAAVCLDSQNHHNPVELHVRGDTDLSVRMHFAPTDARLLANNKDENTATEYGACGVALLLCKCLRDEVFVEQACQLDGGFDYWVGEAEEGRLFNKKTRLEVTGLRNADDAAVRSRVRRKKRTTPPPDDSFPVLIAVVEFSQPLAHMETRK